MEGKVAMKLTQLLKTFRVAGSTLYAEFFATILSPGASATTSAALVYVSGTPIAIDLTRGNVFVVSITDNANFSFAAPTGHPPTGYGQGFTIIVKNTSGGALGTGSWDAYYKTTGNLPAIANTKNRSFGFFDDGTAAIETFATAADVSN